MRPPAGLQHKWHYFEWRNFRQNVNWGWRISCTLHLKPTSEELAVSPLEKTDRVLFRIFREPADPRNSFTRGSLVEFTGIPTALQALFAAEPIHPINSKLQPPPPRATTRVFLNLVKFPLNKPNSPNVVVKCPSGPNSYRFFSCIDHYFSLPCQLKTVALSLSF